MLEIPARGGNENSKAEEGEVGLSEKLIRNPIPSPISKKLLPYFLLKRDTPLVNEISFQKTWECLHNKNLPGPVTLKLWHG